jgi:glycerol uptake facilitator-like aquaporin
VSYRSEDSGFDVQRHILGLVVSVCAAAFVAAAVPTVEAIQYEDTIVATVVLPILFPFFAAIVGIAALSLAFPLTFGLAWLQREAAWSYAILGFICGTTIASLLWNPQAKFTDNFFLSGGLPGAVWGIVWWFSARRAATRSDRA